MVLAEDEKQRLRTWAANTVLEPVHLDCVTAIMLKILDGKCKMGQREKDAIAEVYDVVKTRPGKLLGQPIHALIAVARQGMDEAMVERVYEQRLYAETMISRPVMKGFKAGLRAEGILGGGDSD
jgi:hypothetical protein